MAMSLSGVDQKVTENIFKKYKKLLPKWIKFIDESFLPESAKEEYKMLINKKSIQIGL